MSTAAHAGLRQGPSGSGSHLDSLDELRAQVRLLRSEVDAKEYIAADLRQQVTSLLQQRHEQGSTRRPPAPHDAYVRHDSGLHRGAGAYEPHTQHRQPFFDGRGSPPMRGPGGFFAPPAESERWRSMELLEAQLVRAEEERLAAQRRLTAQVAQAEDRRRAAEALLAEEREARAAAEARARESVTMHEAARRELESELEATRLELEAERRAHCEALAAAAQVEEVGRQREGERANAIRAAEAQRSEMAAQAAAARARLEEARAEHAAAREGWAERRAMVAAAEEAGLACLAECHACVRALAQTCARHAQPGPHSQEVAVGWAAGGALPVPTAGTSGILPSSSPHVRRLHDLGSPMAPDADVLLLSVSGLQAQVAAVLREAAAARRAAQAERSLLDDAEGGRQMCRALTAQLRLAIAQGGVRSAGWTGAWAAASAAAVEGGAAAEGAEEPRLVAPPPTPGVDHIASWSGDDPVGEAGPYDTGREQRRFGSWGLLHEPLHVGVVEVVRQRDEAWREAAAATRERDEARAGVRALETELLGAGARLQARHEAAMHDVAERARAAHRLARLLARAVLPLRVRCEELAFQKGLAWRMAQGGNAAAAAAAADAHIARVEAEGLLVQLRQAAGMADESGCSGSSAHVASLGTAVVVRSARRWWRVGVAVLAALRLVRMAKRPGRHLGRSSARDGRGRTDGAGPPAGSACAGAGRGWSAVRLAPDECVAVQLPPDDTSDQEGADVALARALAYLDIATREGPGTAPANPQLLPRLCCCARSPSAALGARDGVAIALHEARRLAVDLVQAHERARRAAADGAGDAARLSSKLEEEQAERRRVESRVEEMARELARRVPVSEWESAKAEVRRSQTDLHTARREAAAALERGESLAAEREALGQAHDTLVRQLEVSQESLRRLRAVEKRLTAQLAVEEAARESAQHAAEAATREAAGLRGAARARAEELAGLQRFLRHKAAAMSQAEAVAAAATSRLEAAEAGHAAALEVEARATELASSLEAELEAKATAHAALEREAAEALEACEEQRQLAQELLWMLRSSREHAGAETEEPDGAADTTPDAAPSPSGGWTGGIGRAAEPHGDGPNRNAAQIGTAGLREAGRQIVQAIALEIGHASLSREVGPRPSPPRRRGGSAVPAACDELPATGVPARGRSKLPGWRTERRLHRRAGVAARPSPFEAPSGGENPRQSIAARVPVTACRAPPPRGGPRRHAAEGVPEADLWGEVGRAASADSARELPHGPRAPCLVGLHKAAAGEFEEWKIRLGMRAGAPAPLGAAITERVPPGALTAWDRAGAALPARDSGTAENSLLTNHPVGCSSLGGIPSSSLPPDAAGALCAGSCAQVARVGRLAVDESVCERTVRGAHPEVTGVAEHSTTFACGARAPADSISLSAAAPLASCVGVHAPSCGAPARSAAQAAVLSVQEAPKGLARGAADSVMRGVAQARGVCVSAERAETLHLASAQGIADIEAEAYAALSSIVLGAPGRDPLVPPGPSGASGAVASTGAACAAASDGGATTALVAAPAAPPIIVPPAVSSAASPRDDPAVAPHSATAELPNVISLVEPLLGVTPSSVATDAGGAGVVTHNGVGSTDLGAPCSPSPARQRSVTHTPGLGSSPEGSEGAMWMGSLDAASTPARRLIAASERSPTADHARRRL